MAKTALRLLRDAWITLAKRCEPFNIPDVTDSEN
jgi:hypothetical protein